MILFLFIGESFLRLSGLDVQRILRPAGLIAVRKFFGVILLAIAERSLLSMHMEY